MRLTDVVARDWYINYCIEKEAIVEYWDITSLAHEGNKEAIFPGPNYLRCIQIDNELSGLVQLPENKNAVYIMLMSYSGRFSKPYRLLSQYNCKMVFLSWGAMPNVTSAPRWKRICYRFFKNPANFARAAYDVMLGVIYRRLNVVKRYDIAFAAGQALISTNQYAKRVVPFNLCDFDHYKMAGTVVERVTDGKYAVFLDQYLPHHTDFELVGLPVVNPKRYYQSINRFFGLLEKTHGIKVVVAAHPKAIYDSETFEQREIYKLLTAELVKNSEFVVMHTSTALSYAVLNFKPIIFVYTDEMMTVYASTIIRQLKSLSAYLGAAICDVDQVNDGSQIVIQSPSRERYDSYKYSYLTSHLSENSTSAEIFWKHVSAL
jgi:hypothetical protein